MTPSSPFAALGLSDALQRAAAQLGLTDPTPIQTLVLPAALQGRDLRVSAPTGSGKTAAFALPLLQHLLAHRDAERRERLPALGRRPIRALVLVPTRDLAVQVGQVLRDLAVGLPERLKIELAFGGVSVNPQMMALRGGADLVVATPGRLLDLVQHNALRLGEVTHLVLDEADRLLDLGFAEELQQVLRQMPSQRQTVLCSATWPAGVQSLAAAALKDPVVAEVAAAPETLPDIAQRAVVVDTARRTALLRHLLDTETWPRALVFVASRYQADLLAHKLDRQGVPARAFHADFSQGARAAALADFHGGRLRVLVATDVAGRGIDIPGLEVVVNYDLPRSPTDHIHRIGRTGRAGASGQAVSFVTPATEAHFRLIEKRQGLRVARSVVPGFEPTEPAPAPDVAAGGIKGKRKSKKDKLREAAAAAARHGGD